MDRNFSSLTLLFQEPFWVGIAERWDETGYSAARVVFGAQPTEPQLYEWLEKEWHRLKFSPAQEGERLAVQRKNPKRERRENRAATRPSGVSTKAQQALSLQREQEGQARKIKSRQAKLEEAERKFLLRQQKKRDKKRGR
ncbi:DUF2992 family protein [Pseudoflavonifractor sp. 60]|uniref:YjdF family protein n=1 Tax=Pseudoflavonifractor sp. 60 TaxID=2304576 RepID=UPI00136B86D9|nr:YjdF family protein [Pseudoflavonifractor sp. 60]NBI66793.1 DUF2992 family protein [Pseudoflavonifractor sp. 60]